MTSHFFLYLYFMIGLVWSSVACAVQIARYGSNIRRLLVCVTLNLIAWPVGMIMATVERIEHSKNK